MKSINKIHFPLKIFLLLLYCDEIFSFVRHLLANNEEKCSNNLYNFFCYIRFNSVIHASVQWNCISDIYFSIKEGKERITVVEAMHSDMEKNDIRHITKLITPRLSVSFRSNFHLVEQLKWCTELWCNLVCNHLINKQRKEIFLSV